MTDFFIPRQDSGLLQLGPVRGTGQPAVQPGLPLPARLDGQAGLGSQPGPTGPGVYLLTGPGGVGKTQLAVAFAQWLWRSRDIDLLVWVTASSRAAVLTGYAQALADATTTPSGASASADRAVSKGPSAGDDREAMAASFLSWLAGTSRSWLVVLDDLADTLHLAGLWPIGRSGRTVLTTRLEPASISPPTRDARMLRVGAFSRREAISFLTMRLDSLQRVEVLDLAEDLGCLPLPLAQAAAVIADSEIDCREYRARFAGRLAYQISDRSRVPGTGGHDWEDIEDGHVTGGCAVAPVTCSLALDYIDGLHPPAVSRPVLALAALLSPTGIPAAVFASVATHDYVGSYRATLAPTAETDVWAILRTLDRIGIVTVDPASAVRTVRMHAVVQKCVQRILPEAIRDPAVGAAAEALLQAWPARDPDLLLDEALRDCGERLIQAVGDSLWVTGAHPLLMRVGESLTSARLGGPAIGYWRSMIETGRRILGPAHPLSQQFVRRLAQAAEAAGQMDLVIETPGQTLAGLRSARRRAQPRVRGTSPEESMFGLCARFTCRDLKSAAAFDRLVAEATEAITANEPGTLVYSACQVEGQPLLRIFYELYRDKEAFAAHWTAPHTCRYLSRRDAYLASAEAVRLPRDTDLEI